MFYTDCLNAIFIKASFLNQAIRTTISFFTRAHRVSLFKACSEDFNRSKPSLVKHFFCNKSLKTNLTQHLMFQWIRRTSYATYFTLTGSYVDFSFWVLRRRHNIMPTQFLTLLRWSRMHHNLSIAFKRTYLSWIEKKTYVLWKLLTDTWYQQRWIIPICDGNKNKTSVVTDRLHTGGDHIVVTQRNWSNFFQQSNFCSVNSTLYNSVPIQKLNIKSKTLLIKILQLTYEKKNKPGRNRDRVSPSWRQSENDASFPYLKIAAFGRWANQIAALQSSSGLRGLTLPRSIHNFNWTIYWTAGPIRFFEISASLSLSFQNGGFVCDSLSCFRSTKSKIKEARMGKSSVSHGCLCLCSSFVFFSHWR